MQNINYRGILCIGLLILNTFSSCTNTMQSINSREQLGIYVPIGKRRTHDTNWKKFMLLGAGALAVIGTPITLYTVTSSSSDITGLNGTNTNFIPEIIPENPYRYSEHNDLWIERPIANIENDNELLSY